MLCVGLSGLAVGMGAKMPSLTEESPSRIAAGFGGTLNLVVSTIYIVIVVTLTAVPCHFYLVAQQTDPYGTWFNPGRLRWLMVGGISTSLLVGALAAVVPMWIGLKAFRRMEF
jgi:ABC-2 type transport system permease protein